MNEFIPGKTLVHVAGQCFDREERAALMGLATDDEYTLDLYEYQRMRPLQLTAGRRHAELERALAKRFGVKHAVLVNSGSSANLIAFEAMREKFDIPRGSRILTVACAFPTTVAPIVQAGCIPVFLDVGLDGNVDAEALRDVIEGEPCARIEPEDVCPSCDRRFDRRPTANCANPRHCEMWASPAAVAWVNAAIHPPIRGVVLAHALGFPFDLDAVLSACSSHGIPLLADCCDAAGATWRGREVTRLADVSTLSFYPAHHMTTGEGGCVLTDDDRTASIARSLRDWGRDCTCPPDHDNTCGMRFEQPPEVLGAIPAGYDHKYVYSRLGWNLKMTEMQAAIGLVQLDKLDGFIERRKETWAWYHEALHGTPGLHVPLFEIQDEGEPSPFGFLMLSPDRDRIVRELEKRRIQTRPLFAGNLLRHPCMRGVECSVGTSGVGSDWGYAASDPEFFARTLPNTERLMREAFWIGVYPCVTDEMREWVVKSLREIVK